MTADSGVIGARETNVAPAVVLGRPFLSPALDYLLIGGALSLPFVLFAWMNPQFIPDDPAAALMIFLTFNAAHFAASTVRLYTKPGTARELPFVSLGLPLVAFVVVTACVQWPEQMGKNLHALFLTWSPFHYAAQAYGLTVMYCYRSGCALGRTEKSVLYWIAMVPFMRAFLNAPESGLAWIVPAAWVQQAEVATVLQAMVGVLTVLCAALPLGLFGWMTVQRKSFPLIGLLLLGVNGIWWVLLSYTDAWVWATIFHSLQYLVIVGIFHVKDHVAGDVSSHGPVYHAAWFYLVSLALGFVLFFGWPLAYTGLGFEYGQAFVMVTAAINIHHFIVDGFIWHSKKPAVRPAAPATLPQAV